MGSLTSIRRITNKHFQRYQYLKKKVQEEKQTLRTLKVQEQRTKQAQEIIQLVAQAVQRNVHKRIAGLVTKCISTVFVDAPYEFKIHFDRKRGKTEARPVFIRDGKELDPLDGVGGGVLDIATFALRVVCLAIAQPQARKLLVIDEGWKNVNGEGNRERTAQLVLTLAKEFDIQIIMTTGYPWLEIGNVIELS